MNRLILTSEMSAEQLREELGFLVQFFRLRGHTECSVLFGYAWGIEYYREQEWYDITLPLCRLEDEVRRLEAEGLGYIGHDDLMVAFPPVDAEFRFCHDADIHLEFDESSEVIESFHERWALRGYAPKKWIKGNDGKWLEWS